MLSRKWAIFLGLSILGLLGTTNYIYSNAIFQNNELISKTNYDNKFPYSAEIPDGIIGIWTGSIEDIPDGWIICNGSDGSLNLTDRFPYGVGNKENPGELTDPSITTHNHSFSEIPEHTHTITDEGHNHTVLGSEVGYLAGTGTGVFVYNITGSDLSVSNSTTRVSLENTGNSTCKTESFSTLPPYYKVAFIQKTINAPNIIPQGLILLWNNSLTNIPDDWAVCNGSFGTPDLRDRFVMGISNDEEPGLVGGSKTHNHTYYSIPTHNHDIIDPGHNHTYNASSGIEVAIDLGTDVYGKTLGTENYTVNVTTGITIDTSGLISPQTQNTTALPPYLRLAFIQALSDQNFIPKHAIALWRSTWTNIPNGWLQANGTVGTANLTLRFPMSVIDEENPGTVGGNLTHSHPYTDVPTHAHDVIDPGHNHTIKNKTLETGYVLGTDVYGQWIDDSSSSNYEIEASPSYLSVDTIGVESCNTELTSHLPPYCKVIYIQYKNTAPIATNLQIKPAIANTTVDLEANFTYFDADNDTMTDISIMWYRNGSHLAQFNNFTTIPNCYTNKSENWSFTVQFFDGEEWGEIYSSENRTILNLQPTANNVQVLPITINTTTNLEVNYTYFDADNDTMTDFSIIWYRNGSHLAQFNNFTTIPNSYTNKSENWSFTIQFFDGEEWGQVYASENRTILNLQPTASSVRVLPLTVNTTSDLEVNYTYTDLDNDTLSDIRIMWYRNGSHIAQFNNYITIPNSYTNKSENWSFTVQFYDGEEWSIVFTSENRTILNLLPTASNVRVLPLTVNTTSNLEVNYTFFDADNDHNNKTIIFWYRNGSHLVQFDNFTSIPNSHTNKSENWSFTVQFFDGEQWSGVFASENRTILNLLPTASNVRVLPLTVNTTIDLEVNYTYADADNDNKSDVKIMWFRNGSHLIQFDNFTLIPNSYTNKSENWSFTVQFYDGEQWSDFFASENRTISNSLPVALNLQINPAIAYTLDDLTANFTYFDADNDTQNGYEIWWYRNGTLQPLLNNILTISAIWTNRSDQWHFKVRYSDGTEFGNNFTSTNITISNTVPTAFNLNITPQTPYTNNSLVASYNYTDADNDTQKVSLIRWYKNGVLQPQFNNTLTVPYQWTNKTQNWSFTVQPYDGFGYGITYNSTNVTILNSVPTASSLQLTPSTAYTTNNLTASYAYADADNDNQTGSLIRWYKNGVHQSQFDNSQTVPHEWTNKSQNWSFSVQPYDGMEYGIQYNSTNITILNSVPVVTNLQILPTVAYTTDNLTINYTYYDADNDTENGSRIRWSLRNVIYIFEIQSEFNDKKSVPSVWTNKSQVWRVTIEPYDGVIYGNLVTSDPITIQNSLPVPMNVTILPAQANATSTLMVSYDYYDADGDAQRSTTIRWYKDTELQTTLNNQESVSPQYLTKGDVWYYEISVGDALLSSGETVTSPLRLIQNALPYAISLNITPVIPTTTNDLTANFTYYDPDGDPQANMNPYQIRWYRNGTYQPNFDNSLIISHIFTNKSDKWHFEVRVREQLSFDYGAWIPSTNKTIANTVPTASNIQLNPSLPTTTDDLIATYDFADADNDGRSTGLIKWYNNSVYQSKFDNLTSIPHQWTNKSQVWYYTVQPYDGQDHGITYTSNNCTIHNTVPTASNLVITPILPPLLPTTTDNLTANYTYADVDNDISKEPIIYWYRNGIMQTQLTNQTYISHVWTNRSDVWYFIVRPYDGQAYGINYTSNNCSVYNTAPSALNLQITPSSPTTSDDLIANYTYFDADNDIQKGYEIQWYKNGTLQTALYNITTVPHSWTNRSDIWYFSIRAIDDGLFYGNTSTSNNYTIQYTIPTVSLIQITPPNPNTDDDLTATFTYSNVDYEGQWLTEIRWYKNGTLQTQFSNLTVISHIWTNITENWSFAIRPYNNVTSGNFTMSSNYTIQNSAPTISNVVISPDSPTTLNNLTVTYTYSDIDGDLENNTQIKWYRNSVLVPELLNSKTVPFWWTNKTDIWICKIIGCDGINNGTEVQSGNFVAIANSAPMILNAELIPANATAANDLVLNYTYFDADGDIEQTPTIYWYYNNVRQHGLDNARIVPAIYVHRGDVWYVKIKVTDGVIFSIENQTKNVTIVNALPEIRNLRLNVFPVYDSDTIKILYDFYDADRDSAKGTTIKWYLNNEYQSNYDNLDTIPASITIVNQVWTVIITVSDGFGVNVVQNISDIIIYKNEILMILTPGDQKIKQGMIRENISWTITDDTTRNPKYSILVDGKFMILNQSWTPGTPISYEIPELELGKHNITIIVSDGIDSIVQDSIIIQIQRNIPSWIYVVIIIGVSLAIGFTIYSIGKKRNWWKDLNQLYTTAIDIKKQKTKTRIEKKSLAKENKSEKSISQSQITSTPPTTPEKPSTQPPTSPSQPVTSSKQTLQSQITSTPPITPEKPALQPQITSTPPISPEKPAPQPQITSNPLATQEKPTPQPQTPPSQPTSPKVKTITNQTKSIEEQSSDVPTQQVEKTAQTEIFRPKKLGLPPIISAELTFNENKKEIPNTSDEKPVAYPTPFKAARSKNAELISPEMETGSQIQHRSTILVDKITPHIKDLLKNYQIEILSANPEELERLKLKLIEEARSSIAKNVQLHPRSLAAMEKHLPKTLDKEIELILNSIKLDDLLDHHITPAINSAIYRFEEEIITANPEELIELKQKIQDVTRMILKKNGILTPTISSAIEKILPSKIDREIELYFDSLADE